MLPFTHDQFLAVFVAYNEAVWPAGPAFARAKGEAPPLLGQLLGPGYPAMPMFGITPCPVTLFTFGLFLLTTEPIPRRLLVIPVIWSLIGGQAAFLLGTPQDWLLFFSGVTVLVLLRRDADCRRDAAGLAAA